MNLFVAGANGGTGRKVVEQALAAGHRVVALVRDPAKLSLSHPNLEVVKGDICRVETFAHYLVNQDAVISALGVRSGLFGDRPTTLYSEGSANLLAAMHRHRVKRAIFISASALDISPVLPWYVRFFAKNILQKLLKHMYADLRLMEAVVKATAINWTIVRPPQLTNGPLTASFRIAINQFLKNSLKISRADLANFMLDHLEDEATYQAVVEIGY
jgi:putative NADH-flavin reductase